MPLARPRTFLRFGTAQIFLAGEILVHKGRPTTGRTREEELSSRPNLKRFYSTEMPLKVALGWSRLFGARRGLARSSTTFQASSSRRHKHYTMCGWTFDSTSGIAVQRNSKSTSIAINNPEKLNPLTEVNCKAMRAALAIEEKGRLVLTYGLGGRALSAGGDILSMAKLGNPPMNEPAPGLGRVFPSLHCLCVL